MTYPITINPTTDGQLPKYTSKHPDGHRAVIESVTGTVANGETLTINGHFSAKRDGDLFSLISTTADSGVSIVPTYYHSQGESFLGSGSSIMRVMHNPGSGGDPRINIGQHDELYCSYLYKINVSNYGVELNDPQLKMQRMMVPAENQSGSSSTSIYIYGEGATYNGAGLRPGVNGIGDCYPDADEWTGITEQDTLNTWVRKWEYIKKQEGGLKNGSSFMVFKIESLKECIFNCYGGGNDMHINDSRITSREMIAEFFTPKYFHELEPGATDGTDIMLPFYVKGGLEMEIFYDGLIVNDSPESVWLINGTDVDAAMATGKAVQLPQLSRNTETIQAECWLGDLIESDNIYAVAFNQDGKKSAPILVRSAL